jgi:hypothetical protein
LALDLDELPTVARRESEPVWHPLQHTFGLTAFGANAFVAGAAGDVLVEEHDESGSGQEEFYIVVRGRVELTIGGTTRPGRGDPRRRDPRSGGDAERRRPRVGHDAGRPRRRACRRVPLDLAARALRGGAPPALRPQQRR